MVARFDVAFASLASLRESFLESVYDARDAILDQDNIEIDKQPQAFVGQFQIAEELLLVHGCDSLHRLDLHDHFVLYDQVGVKAGIDTYRLVDYRYGLLACDA